MNNHKIWLYLPCYGLFVVHNAACPEVALNMGRMYVPLSIHYLDSCPYVGYNVCLLVIYDWNGK